MTFSQQIANEAHEKGFEIMLHFPMESFPKDSKQEKTGPGAIFSNMTQEEIKEVFSKNFVDMPHIKGINNHMGSKITSDERIMRIFFDLVKEKDLFFIDSLVINKSVARRIADEKDIKFSSRDVFLDNIDDPIYIRGQFIELIEIAEKYGKAIGIGHVERINTAEVIKEMLPELKSCGIEIVPVSEIVE